MITTIAWMILGASNSSRTSKSFSSLKREVASLFGEEITINSPLCYYKKKTQREEVIDGKKVIKDVFIKKYIELVKSDIEIKINLDQRKKGNLWFPTFQSEFIGEYIFQINNNSSQYYVYSTLESSDSIYRDIILKINDKVNENILPLVNKQEISVTPNDKNQIKLFISYKCTGMEELLYFITTDENEICQINDFNFKIITDFKNFDFPNAMMSPINKIETDNGFELLWQLKNAATGKDIGIVIPNKLNPGEIVTRVTFFAPVSLLFFFIVIFIIAIILKVEFHPMHYFFLAATFFSFHLMYSYFSEHLNLYITFGISSIVSLILTVTYLRLFAPKKITFLYAPISQIIYLVIFSFSFFYKGISGLIVTICSVITLFILMQITGKIKWDEVFKKN